MSPDDPRHGTQNGYGNLNCRCTECRAAHADHQRVGKPARQRKSFGAARLAAYHWVREHRPDVWADIMAGGES